MARTRVASALTGSSPNDDHGSLGPAVGVGTFTETTHTVELTQQGPGLAFTARFICGETGWHAAGYEASQTTRHESEHVFRTPPPEVFELVNYWLLTENHMAVLPHSWHINSLDADNRLSLLGHAAPARITG